jgi:hypothetical protein
LAVTSFSASAIVLVALAAGAGLSIDTLTTGRDGRTARAIHGITSPTPCEGRRPALPHALFFELRSGAFPGSGHADVAVHVPPGFDATRLPGLVLYLHGWQGCAAASLSSDEGACEDAGPAGVDLAAAVDAAGVNALFIAIETRFQLPTGEPGNLAMPGAGRDLLRELLGEHLGDALGCDVPLEAIDRIAVIAHSGGYQAEAGLLALGDLPNVTDVILLDALYGADDLFARWIENRARRFDPRAADAVRFVDLYTCCGGTADASRRLARRTREALERAQMRGAMLDDDSDDALDTAMLKRPIVFKRVPLPHAAVPGAEMRALVESAGFARIRAPL